MYVTDACDERTFHYFDKGLYVSTFHAIDTPNGRVAFIGKVPTALITEDEEIARAPRHSGGIGLGGDEPEPSWCAPYISSYATFDEARAAVGALNGEQVQ